MALLPELMERVPGGGSVLDAGCGAGVPVSDRLIHAGLRVTGLDFSAGQLRLARTTFRPGDLVRGDLSALPFGTSVFDAVVSYYAIIHVPRSEHAALFTELGRVLRPGGAALLCVGWGDLPEDHDPESWLGAPMYWSHFDADTNVRLLEHAGFGVEWARQVPDPMGHASHLFVLATGR
jgi:SAM-dependent methyltransferase